MMEEVSESKSAKSKAAAAAAVDNGGGGFFRQFRRLDIYPKIDENYRVRTSGGAIFSLVCWGLIAVLALAELRNYANPTYKEHLVVDTSLGKSMSINLNITFHALTCAEVHLDAMDVAGDNQLNIEHDMVKQRISPEGQTIGKPGVEIIGEGDLPPMDALPPDFCGPCYGAETEQIKCCNTCEELLRAYEEKRWSTQTVMRNSTQCLRDRAQHFAGVERGEGCTVSGTMRVNKVAGNFHIAHGDSVVRDGKHIHQFNPVLAPSFNISHTIHSLSFGDPFPFQHKDTLDGVERIIGTEQSTGLYQYFIKVIPTIYTEMQGSKAAYTNTYTYTDRFRPLLIPDFNGVLQHTEAILPGIFFIYDLSPFMIQASSEQMPLLHLLTKLCAIVGGVFTVMGVVDATIYRLHKYFSRKNK